MKSFNVRARQLADVFIWFLRFRALVGVKRGFMYLSAIIVAFSTVEAGLFLFFEQRAAALGKELGDPISAITEHGRAPKPATQPALTSDEQLGIVSEAVRKQAKTPQDIPPTAPPKPQTSKKAEHVREDESKRTERSKTFINKDGSKSVEFFNEDIAYKENGALKELRSTVSDLTDFSSIPTQPLSSLLGSAAPGLATSKSFVGDSGPMKGLFQPLANQNGVKVTFEGKEVKILPLSAANANPERSRQDGTDYITYKKVWDDVDLVYEYRGDHIKEFIVLNKKPKTTTFSFKLPGTTLREATDAPGAIDVLKDGKLLFVLPPLTVIAKEKGPVSDSNAQYIIHDDTVTVQLDQKWLDKQEAKHYPIAIDPTVQPHYAKYEITNGGNDFWAYKSDGYTCPSWSCWINTGQLQDNGTKYWRSMMRIPFDAVAGKDIHGAALHMYKQMSGPSWYGTNNAARYWVTWAPCFGFNCVNGGAPWMPITIGTEGHADLKPLIEWMASRGQWGGWLIIHGDDSPYKGLNSQSTSLELWYNTPPPVPTKFAPLPDQTLPTNMPRLEVQQAGDADGDSLSYLFHIHSNGHFVASSGYQSSPRWTVPEGLLEDGAKYEWYALTHDGYKPSNWTGPTSFTVDLRTGKDKTQTYDTMGLMSVNLADGNAYTSVDSHSVNALGGSMGLSLEYNTPHKSVKGLSANYYNDAGGRRLVMSRTDPTVDFEWGGSSPKPGTVDQDNFAVNWQGYFIAPQTGAYTFGGTYDDLFSMSIDTQRNGQYQLQFDFGCCNGGVGWAGQTVNLTAGQAYPISVWNIEHGGAAYARLWVRTPDGGQQVVPQEWVRTQSKPVTENQGMIGKFYKDTTGAKQFNPTQPPFLVQRYPEGVNIDWREASPMAYDPDGYFRDDYMVRFSGYLTVPVSGTYTFGSGADDGQRIYVNGAKVADMWSDHGHTDVWSGPITLQKGQVVPIVLEYFEHTGAGSVNLQWNGPAGAGLIPGQYLSTDYRILPAGWSLSIDADGKLPYERLNALSNGNVDLIDGDGTLHSYTFTGSGFKPPVNEDGALVRNSDGTYTLADVDGRVYVFSAEGVILNVTSPVDDRKPAAIRYEYQSQSNVPKLKKIVDGVDPARYGELFYGGDSQCVTPAGFQTAPLGYLCAYHTYDGQKTHFYYNGGRLARVELPGGALTDYVSDEYGRLASVRDVLANDAIATGVRAADGQELTNLSYDPQGRLSSIKMPAPQPNASRLEQKLEYGTNNTKRRTVNAPEPYGFSQYVEYDPWQRTTKVCDVANLCTRTEWHSTKDVALSTTNHANLKTTMMYDADMRLVDQYGPAPSNWYAPTNLPLTQYRDQIQRTSTAYDEGLWGPAVAWYDFKGNSLFGAPKLHATGFNDPAGRHVFAQQMSTAPITKSADADGIGFSATGKLRVTQSGTFNFTSYHDDAAKLWIDDKVVFDRWNVRNDTVTGVGGQVYLEAGKVYRLRFDYATVGTPGSMSLHMEGPGKTNPTHHWDGYLAPGYNLVTTNTSFDVQIGDSTTKTNYGPTPEYGLKQSVTLDPSGLNLSTSSTYEAPGAGYLRQKSKVAPGGSRTDYAYYAGNALKDNPCTTAIESFRQAGRLQRRIEADPDGGGAGVSRTSETIYDNAGRTVAVRYNSDPWICTTYDARSRVTQTKVPALGDKAQRIVKNEWAVDGNPLKTSNGDEAGTTYTEVDLIGRVVVYSDIHGSSTTSTYDHLGQLVTREGDLGLEQFSYDEFGRLFEQKLDGELLAKVFYDNLSRITRAEYPSSNVQLAAVSRDEFGRSSGATWQFSDGSTLSDRVTRSQSGKILTNITQAGTEELWRTFGYDKAQRLISADIGPHTFRYGFGAQTGCATGTNTNSGKNGNRTSQTINGVTTKYCYDYADRLVSSTDPLLSGVEYDGHGNTTKLGNMHFEYDSSDRNVGVEQYDTAGQGVAMYYDRDVLGRVTGRYKTDIVDWEWIDGDDWYYSFTTTDDTPDIVRNANWDIIEKYVSLPGGVLLGIRPQDETQDGKARYSLPGMTGNILALADGEGTNISDSNGPGGSFTYDPFGNPLPGGTQPQNYEEGSYGWHGRTQKATETSFALPFMQMGARDYLPYLGRFLQADLVEGGGANNYAYALDPINLADLTGFFWKEVGDFLGGAKGVVAVAGVAACILATAGWCAAGIAVGAAVAAGASAANTMDKTGDWKKASVNGLIAGAVDASIGIVAGKVAGAKEVVRWFGKVGDTTRYYTSVSKALTKKPAQDRLMRQVGSGVINESINYVTEPKDVYAPASPSSLLRGIYDLVPTWLIPGSKTKAPYWNVA